MQWRQYILLPIHNIMYNAVSLLPTSNVSKTKESLHCLEEYHFISYDIEL